MHVTILGSGSPQPNLARSQPSVWIEHDGFSLLVDCGEGTMRQLQRKGVDLAKVTAVLFTHLHSDHSLGYGHFLIAGWSMGRRELTVFGPLGTQSFHDVWLKQLYSEDIKYRIGLGRNPRGLTENVKVNEACGEGAFELGPFLVKYLPVMHSIPTFALRLESPGGDSIVISGDTAYYEPLANFASGTNILIHEACMGSKRLDDPNRIQRGESSWKKLGANHSTAEEAGLIAEKAGARHLVLTHLLPGIDPTQTFSECRKVYSGPLTVAEDLMEWETDTTSSQQTVE